jgi:coenzyme F420-0:L-glutamate ligase/coenzyme F420-1:gamma-L-glutamate ligase
MVLIVTPIEGVGEVREGDDLAGAIVAAAGDEAFLRGDVLVVAHKVVSKSEGRVVSGVERQAAALAESARVLRRRGDMILSVTRHGFVCANAGVDASNVPGDSLVLLPLDPDLSARRIRGRLAHLTGVEVAVIVSDTFGRAWRNGQTNVAIGVSGIEPFVDHRGSRDMQGRELDATSIAIADELAGAAEMVMGKAKGICAALIRGAPVIPGRGAAAVLVRRPEEDLFR